MTQNARQLADIWTAAARENFDRDGVLVPIVALLGEKNVIIALNDLATGNFQLSTLTVISLLSACFDRNPDHVVVVCEGWSKELPFEEGMEGGEDYRKGQLQREVEAGATDIHTVLSVTVFDTKFPDRSHTTMTNVDKGMERRDFPGKQAGGVADKVYEALLIANEARDRRPAEYSVDRALSYLQPMIAHATVGE